MNSEKTMEHVAHSNIHARSALSISDFGHNGVAIVQTLLTPSEIHSLTASIDASSVGDLRGGLRLADKIIPAIKKLTNHQKIASLARQHLDGPPTLIRAILFNKTLDQNWPVAWHQDKTVIVNTPFEQDNWVHWSLKAGKPHVQPPLSVLEKMVTVRIHLDDATAQNGCLRVIPCSHKKGILQQKQVLELAKNSDAIDCVTLAGDALVMKPLIIHASNKSVLNSDRRIIHLEFSDYQLPKGINWG